MRTLALVLTALFASQVVGEDKPPVDDAKLLANLNIIAVPIGEKGMIIKDEKGCMWVLKNAQPAPQLVAIIGEETQKPLCAKGQL